MPEGTCMHVFVWFFFLVHYNLFFSIQVWDNKMHINAFISFVSFLYKSYIELYFFFEYLLIVII